MGDFPKKRERTRTPAMNGMKEIAAALGISIGTVDRALHDRRGVSPLTRSRVLEEAKRLGYEPNLAARDLRLNHSLRISVNLPQGPFFDQIRQGVREGAGPVKSSVRLESRCYPSLSEGALEQFEDALASGVQGLIVPPGNPVVMNRLIRKANDARVAVVCVATDAPESGRLTAVMAHPYTCGSMAAELMTLAARDPGSAAVLTGECSNFNHSEKIRGFRATLSRTSSLLTFGPVLEAHDDAAMAKRLVEDLVSKERNLRALYISTANSISALQALEIAGLLHRMLVVTTDLFPQLMPYITNRKVLGSVYQNPKMQGISCTKSTLLVSSKEEAPFTPYRCDSRASACQ